MTSEHVIGQVRLESDRLLLRQACRNANAVAEFDGEPNGYVFVNVRADDYEEFEGAMDLDETVADYQVLDTYKDHKVYRVEKSQDAITMLGMPAELDGRTIGREVRRDGWRLKMYLPDRDCIVSLNEMCKDMDIIFIVEKLRHKNEFAKDFIELTDKQQEILKHAYTEGYFDVPRSISQKGIAEEFDMSKAGVSQILRRAMSEVCKNKLEEDNAI